MHYKDKFVGLKLYGYCSGYFGRDSYEDKIVIASGEDWLVAKDTEGVNVHATFEEHDNMEELVNEWATDHLQEEEPDTEEDDSEVDEPKNDQKAITTTTGESRVRIKQPFWLQKGKVKVVTLEDLAGYYGITLDEIKYSVQQLGIEDSTETEKYRVLYDSFFHKKDLLKIHNHLEKVKALADE